MIHLETTVVHPDFRGLGLQKLTLDYATKWSIAKGYRYMFCTVSPYNPISLNNIMSGGLKVRDLKKKYGNEEHPGYLRYILSRDLNVSCNDCWPKFKFCPITDIDTQKKLIETGFVGHHYLKSSQRMAYAKCLC
ncbi:MAG: GNAT family N-acetyltransferase [Proteocatella sp.]